MIAGGLGLIAAVLAAPVEPTSAAENTAADIVVMVEPNGRWHIPQGSGAEYTFFYGNPGDVPLFGDWDGDGLDTPGMFRPSNGFAYLTNGYPPDGGFGVADRGLSFFFGMKGDQVVVGDWNGNGADSLGIRRGGKMFLTNVNATVAAEAEFIFGDPGDIAYGGDPNGDGYDSIYLNRASSGFVYYTNQITGPTGVAPTADSFFYGVPSDRFVIGDWDADGVDSVGIFRPPEAMVYLRNANSQGPADTIYPWGQSDWMPVAGKVAVVSPSTTTTSSTLPGTTTTTSGTTTTTSSSTTTTSSTSTTTTTTIPVGDPEDLSSFVPSIGTTQKNFTFAVWGDPQVATYDRAVEWLSHRSFKRKQDNVNPILTQSVDLTNILDPEFVISLGDNIHGRGQWEHFVTFTDLVAPLTSPLYLLMGNHDWGAGAEDYPTNPYGTREFGNFIWAQEQLNGLSLVNMSFNAGDWHLVLLAQPGGSGRGINRAVDDHPEWFEWLDADLKANQNRPTMFFTHHPLLPVGRRQLDAYGYDADHRDMLVDILSRYGNVKFAFFGHAHNTVASIPLISWNYRGTSYIVVPNSANGTRAADYVETTTATNGALMIDVQGRSVSNIEYHTLHDEAIPVDFDSLQSYDNYYYFYGYLFEDSELPVEVSIVNGGFEEPLNVGWFGNHLLDQEGGPRQIRSREEHEGSRYLSLDTSAHPDIEANSPSFVTAEVRQSISVPNEADPVLRVMTRIPGSGQWDPKGSAMGFVAVSAFESEGDSRIATIMYSLEDCLTHRNFKKGTVCYPQSAPPFDAWREMLFHIRSDYEANFTEVLWQDLNNLTVTLGSYNQNYSPGGDPVNTAIHFDDVSLQ